MLSILCVLLLSLNVSASESINQSNFVYDFPGCEGGGGSWPKMTMTLPHAICSLDETMPEVVFSGRCNGRLTLGVTCQDAVIESVQINDCFCD